ncbi:hypothetical protein [Pseudonocardia xinjiangensis]|uniref:Uncharacterized protein n=1 Tax=Pseudonocardia xinjiangensis TaxID=75289 RepID=A0ABX1RLN9_9PSEU|nr:hypothetical protein [Pseudonocardia xinjiangensis]NMH80015.1 hypothetical protein [Pseudonocardia xinjiangensis]
MDDPEPFRADVAYIACHVRDGQVITHIAGVHALGSVGAAHYLSKHVAELCAEMGEKPFSMAVAAELDCLTPKVTAVSASRRAWV